MNMIKSIMIGIGRFFRKAIEYFTGNYPVSPVKKNKIMCRAGGYAHRANFKSVLLIMISFGMAGGKISSDLISDVSKISDISKITVFFGAVIGAVIGSYIAVLIATSIRKFLYLRGFRGFFSVVIGAVSSFVIGVVIGVVILLFFIVVGCYLGDILVFLGIRLGDILVFLGVFLGDILVFLGDILGISLCDILCDILVFLGVFFDGGVFDDLTKEDVFFMGFLIIPLIFAFLAIMRYDKWRLGYLGEIATADGLYKVGCQQRRIFHGLKTAKKQHPLWRRCLQWLIFHSWKTGKNKHSCWRVCQRWIVFHIWKFSEKRPCWRKCLRWLIFRGWKDDGNYIDHIIVCKKGVFCVKTKTCRKYPKVDTKISFKSDEIYIHENENEIMLKDNTIGQVQWNADWLYREINKKFCEPKEDSFVIPIVIFPGWSVEAERKPDDKIVVCNLQQISDILKKIKGTPLSDDEFNKICKFLEEATEIKLLDVR